MIRKSKLVFELRFLIVLSIWCPSLGFLRLQKDHHGSDLKVQSTAAGLTLYGSHESSIHLERLCMWCTCWFKPRWRNLVNLQVALDVSKPSPPNCKPGALSPPAPPVCALSGHSITKSSQGAAENIWPLRGWNEIRAATCVNQVLQRKLVTLSALSMLEIVKPRQNYNSIRGDGRFAPCIFFDSPRSHCCRFSAMDFVREIWRDEENIWFLIESLYACTMISL